MFFFTAYSTQYSREKLRKRHLLSKKELEPDDLENCQLSILEKMRNGGVFHVDTTHGDPGQPCGV